MKSLLLYEPYANEASQICHFLAVRPQFESVHRKKRRLSSHSYSHESVIFRIFGINIFKVTASLRFLSLTARGYVQPLTTEHCGSVHYITIGDSRLLTAAGLTRSPLYLIGDAASRCGLSRVGHFIPLNGHRPLNGHPPSTLLFSNRARFFSQLVSVAIDSIRRISQAKRTLLFSQTIYRLTD